MASHDHDRCSGFSLVELMVAVLFVGILMAGMANVFKSSVSTLTASSEGISSARRNRMSMDLLYDDLNNAGLYLTDLSSPPALSTANPSFYILPNMPIAGAAADDPKTADRLLFYMDQALAFEGTLTSTGGGGTPGRTASMLVDSGVANPGGVSLSAGDFTYTIDCKDPSYANMLKIGNEFIIKSASVAYAIKSTPTVTGSSVNILVGGDAFASVTGLGPTDTPSSRVPILGAGVLFFNPAQMVQYSVVMLFNDPQRPTGVPCLVRDQGTYDPTGFVADPAQRSILAENVSGFKVFLSANTGQAWIGLGKNYSGFNAGWTAGMRADLDAQLALVGRPGFTSTVGKEHWIRDIPVLVRLDITTRTATKRSEYSATPLTTTAFKDFTQSLVIVPRHFGLSMDQ